MVLFPAAGRGGKRISVCNGCHLTHSPEVSRDCSVSDSRNRLPGWKAEVRKVQPWGGYKHVAGRDTNRPVRHQDFAECKIDLLSDVPFCGRLPRGAAVFPGVEERRVATGVIRGGAVSC